MKIRQFQSLLKSHADHELRFVLPNGDPIPAHAHVTEAGRIDKTFIDCGGTVRRLANCVLQAWVADDIEHRLTPGKLAAVMAKAAEIFRDDDLDVEIEYEDRVISQYPVVSVTASPDTLCFQLGSKHTDCLAKDFCLPPIGCTSPGCC